jgi:long-chain acyl-CoA synthetase
VQRGDRVAIYLNNSVEAVVSIFAVLKAGAVFVSINPTTKRDKLIYILNNCHAVGLLLDGRKQELAVDIQAAVPWLKFAILCGGESDFTPVEKPLLDYTSQLNEHPAHRPARTNIDLDLACLIYTSGTTGDPKGVMSDHSNVVFAASSIIQYLENVEEDIVIDVLPLSFDYGLYQLLMTFKYGGTLVLERSFAYPAQILSLMAKERVTGFPGVPTIYAILLQMDLSPFDLSSLRYLTNTAAALPPSHILQLRDKFPWARLYSMYGLTETKRTLYLPPEQLDRRPGSVGIAIPGTEVWLEDETGNHLPPGEVGELVVRGRHVMRGYWEAPEATAERYRPGPIPGERLCYTGDLFRMDEGGYLYFVGRKDDIIKSRGEKVAPKEVENTLYSMQGVLEAAVIGVPDLVLGQAVKAILVMDSAKVSEAQVLAFCRTHMEDFMVPKYIEFRSELPKTSSGKIKKTDLR